MINRRFLLVPLVGALLLGGCVSGKDIERLEEQIGDLQFQIAELKRQTSSREDVERLNQKIVTQTEDLMRSSAGLTVKMAEVDDRLANLQGSIEQTNYRVDRLVQQVAQNERAIASVENRQRQSGAAGSEPMDEVVVTPGTAPGAPSAPRNPAPAAGDPLEIYQNAYRDYQRGNFDLAIQGFQDYVRLAPDTDLADNAAYWIGESLFSQKKYRDAIRQFDTVINRYPRSDKVPGALLKKGYAYVELGEKAQGVVQLQYVIHEHPRSPEATLAKQKLRSLGIETR